MANHFIVGDNNKVSGNVSRAVLINCDNQTFTEENEGETIFNDGNLVIDTNGLTKAAVKRRRATLSGTGNTIAFNDGITLFFIDASAGNVAVTIEHSDLDRIFIRVDNTANTATLTPDSGLINGAASYNVAVQYGKITVISDGTDLYF